MIILVLLILLFFNIYIKKIPTNFYTFILLVVLIINELYFYKKIETFDPHSPKLADNHKCLGEGAMKTFWGGGGEDWISGTLDDAKTACAISGDCVGFSYKKSNETYRIMTKIDKANTIKNSNTKYSCYIKEYDEYDDRMCVNHMGELKTIVGSWGKGTEKEAKTACDTTDGCVGVSYIKSSTGWWLINEIDKDTVIGNKNTNYKCYIKNMETFESTPEPTTTSLPPTTTSLPPTTTSLPPTTTSLPPTPTSLPPTTTSLPPTTTSLPPTTTSLPPTTTSLPPTTTSLPPTTTSLPPTTTSLSPTTTSLPPTTTSLSPTTTSLPPTTTSLRPTTTTQDPRPFNDQIDEYLSCIKTDHDSCYKIKNINDCTQDNNCKYDYQFNKCHPKSCPQINADINLAWHTDTSELIQTQKKMLSNKNSNGCAELTDNCDSNIKCESKYYTDLYNPDNPDNPDSSQGCYCDNKSTILDSSNYHNNPIIIDISIINNDLIDAFINDKIKNSISNQEPINHYGLEYINNELKLYLFKPTFTPSKYSKCDIDKCKTTISNVHGIRDKYIGINNLIIYKARTQCGTKTKFTNN